MSDSSSGQSSFQTVNGGISLFLLTFIILCLVSFAALSIVSARADARLTEKYRQQTEYYYGARNEAQKFLQGLDGGAGAGINDGGGAGAISGTGIGAGGSAAAENGAGAGASDAGAVGTITRRFSAGPHMDLILTVQPAGGQHASEASTAVGKDTSEIPAGSGQDGRNYRVICEKTESTITYNYDSTLPVMKR